MFTKRGTTIGILLAAATAALMPLAAEATTKYWEPADGIGNWNYGPYWNPAGVPVADDIARIEAGGDGWVLYCNYINATNPLLTSVYIGNLSTGTAEARIVQSQDALHTGYEYVGYNGVGKHLQSGGTVTVDNTLYLGRLSGSYGYYELSGGTLSAVYPHIGYGGDGDFVQTGGTFTCTQMNISNANYGGPYGVGSYTMHTGTLNADLLYIGGKQEGTFTQLGGTVNALASGLTLGLDQYGGGYYTLSNGDLNTNRTRVSQAGSTFTQTDGTHHITGNLEIGFGPDVAHEALFTLSGGQLDVGGDVIIGDDGWGSFHQIAGTAIVTGTVTTLDPPSAPPGKVQLDGGSLTATSVDNDGEFVQTGGEFVGHLINNGTFTYDGGTFDQSTLTNYGGYGSVNLNGWLACRRIVNYGSLTVVWDHRLYADGSGYPNAFENDGSLTLYPRSELNLYNFTTKLVNNGQMYAGGAIPDEAYFLGTLENHGYLIPCAGGADPGHLYVNGNFTAFPGAELRIRIRGTALGEYDHMYVQFNASLGGELDVRLTEGFVPSLGDSFDIVGYATGVGQFDPVYLPALPNDWEWRLEYTTNNVRLTVVESSQGMVGDLNCDGSVGFGDINPFVLYLSNYSAWQQVYADCPPENGDINGDGSYPSFGDINPFVALLTQ